MWVPSSHQDLQVQDASPSSPEALGQATAPVTVLCQVGRQSQPRGSLTLGSPQSRTEANLPP